MPWHQGLLLKRKDEVTELYAEMIADKVITLQNIGDELLTGPRSDRTRQMLLRPAAPGRRPRGRPGARAR